MEAGIAVPRTHRANGIRACNGGQRTTQPGGRQSQQIIEPGRRPAEAAVAGVAVADHRVQGVDRAVRHQSRNSGRRTPDEGGHYRIGTVLRDGFDHRAGDLVRVQAGGVTADEVPYPDTGPVEVSGVQ